MADSISHILKALEDHRAETRADMQELRSATTKMADAMGELSRTMARSEERHSQHEHTMQRIGGTLDDHEGRIRDCEKQLNTNTVTLTTGWHAAVAIGGGLVAMVTVVVAVIKVFA